MAATGFSSAPATFLRRMLLRDAASRRLHAPSAALLSKKITRVETEDEIVVDAVANTEEDASRKKSLLKPCDGRVASEQCHPLCRFPYVHEIKHTDVLILDQFVDSKGGMLDRDVTGLCNRQQVRISKLVKMAQKAGLMPGKDIYAAEKEDRVKTPWARYNTYWDEKTIDAQWHEARRKRNIQSFRK